MVVIHREEGKISYETNKEEIDILEHILYYHLNDFIKFPNFNVPEKVVMPYVISCRQSPKINMGHNDKNLNLKIEYCFNQIFPYKVMAEGCFELNLNVKTEKVNDGKTKKYYNSMGNIHINKFIISKEK